ncbi:hypothetical protein EJ04DRAFT_506493 [Polyplosphaeria fusca]|uniref:Uncharacterized protein n=1 Tax=Polyplosphaeria fusca TaxID=682080 RepID=A0A9P4USP0_9PLEO|nr:hypothetical protein EJ04DRAFT_506493 [Polyplosphaeria fusca]
MSTEPRFESENQSDTTAYTPTQDTCQDPSGYPKTSEGDNELELISSIPWPKSTYILSSKSDRRVLTLLDGEVILDTLGGRGSIHWELFESRGWYGIRNVPSGRLLGHDKKGKLICEVKIHNEWECFTPRARPDGGHDLLMRFWDNLVPVCLKTESGKERLFRITDGKSKSVVWEFTKV